MNVAIIDAQNLVLSTTKCVQPWKIDLYKFREYLRRKYDISKAYYFIGHTDEEHENLYDLIQSAGFILKFREHTPNLKSKKKGNVDTDIVFTAMYLLYKNEVDDVIFLVSGDGDYKKLVDFLIEENAFGRILFPNRKNTSSLYKKLTPDHYAFLDDKDVKRKIEYTN